MDYCCICISLFLLVNIDSSLGEIVLFVFWYILFNIFSNTYIFIIVVVGRIGFVFSIICNIKVFFIFIINFVMGCIIRYKFFLFNRICGICFVWFFFWLFWKGYFSNIFYIFDIISVFYNVFILWWKCKFWWIFCIVFVIFISFCYNNVLII